MKYKDRIYLCIMFFCVVLLLGCDNLYQADGDVSNITSKTSIQDFSGVNQPIVITMPVYDSYHLFGISSWSEQRRCEGDVFVVIDWENDTVFDWVFQESPGGMLPWRCVEQGTAPVRYCTTSTHKECVYFLEQGKTSVTTQQSGVAGWIDSYSSPGTRGLLLFNAPGGYPLAVFDVAEGQHCGDILIETSTVGYVFQPHADEEGNFWVAYPQDATSYVSKINTDTVRLEAPITSFTNWNAEESDAADAKELDIYSVVGACKGSVFVARNASGDGTHKPVLYVIDTNAADPQESMVRIPCPEGLDADYHYIYDGVCYGGSFYATVCGAHGDDRLVYICAFDPTAGTARVLAGPILFDMTETIWLRGSRLYMMKSRKLTDVFYMYCDLDTGEMSGITEIRLEDLVR